VERTRLSGSRWLPWVPGALMLAVAALDLVFKGTTIIPALVIIVMAAALLVGPGLTVWLAAFALVLTIVVGMAHDDFASADGWIQLFILLAASVIAVTLALVLESRRERLAQQEEQFRLLAENASDIVTRVSLDGTLEWISPSVTSVLGWAPEQLVGTHPWDLVHPDDRAAAAASLAAAAAPGNEPSALVTRFKKVDGSYTWLSALGRRAPDGPFIVSFRQVDDEIQAQEALKDSEMRYRLLAENAMDLVFSMDKHAIIEWVSPSSLTMLGYPPDELIGEFGGMLILPEDLPILLDAATQAREGIPASCQIRMLTKDGDSRWVDATPRSLLDDTGALAGGVIGVRDIHEEVMAREALTRAFEFDALTGLANPALALSRIQEVLDSRRDEGWALLCVGVNGMTAINQAYTYSAGDVVLKSVADRLVEAAGSEDLVARIAGDEFVVLRPDVVGATEAATAADSVLNSVRGPVPYGEVEIDVTAGVGIALAGHSGADDLLRDSAAAMRQAAIKGPDRWEFLDGDVAEQTRAELALQASLREAIRSGHIVPWYMPIVRLEDGGTVGYEILARWVRDHGSVSLPYDFLKSAERTGLIVAIDYIMLERALTLLHHSEGTERFAVNMSAATLASGSLTDRIVTLLEHVDVDLRRLHLEVTETALFTVTEDVRRTMDAIAGLGVSWWVDDFGTGFSSISHLRDLPIAGLKLDQSFTSGLTAEATPAVHLAQGLVGLAEGLGLQTVAEGVETVEQAAVLLAQGWQYGQGWLYGRAIASLPTPE
jgi:PAS domain S-box-containing protein/diguanylate cyclase (GGDEF)-like protein